MTKLRRIRNVLLSAICLASPLGSCAEHMVGPQMRSPLSANHDDEGDQGPLSWRASSSEVVPTASTFEARAEHSWYGGDFGILGSTNTRLTSTIHMNIVTSKNGQNQDTFEGDGAQVAGVACTPICLYHKTPAAQQFVMECEASSHVSSSHTGVSADNSQLTDASVATYPNLKLCHAAQPASPTPHSATTWHSLGVTITSESSGYWYVPTYHTGAWNEWCTDTIWSDGTNTRECHWVWVQ